MPMAKTRPDGTSVLHIEGDMSIYRAAELKAALLTSLDQAGELEVDLAAVTEFDTAGVQILMLAKQQAQAMQKTLRLIRHSPAVLEVFELLNLAAYFGDPLVISSEEAFT